MSDGTLKQCKICGTQYRVCYSCEKKHSWRVHTDTAEHFYIFEVLMSYQLNHNAKKAYQALKKRNIDFFDIEKYLPNVQELLKEIYSLSHENSSAKKEAITAPEPTSTTDECKEGEG